MESSVASSEASSVCQESRVPSIHIDEFLMEEHAKGLAKHEGPKIFTVAQTLKDPFILSHIKPDYGSLGEFMVDASLRKDFLTQKKRKNEGAEEEFGDKKIRQQFKDKTNQQLNQIYLSKTSSSWEKKIASKLMVENIFKETFQIPLQTFETQNIKQELPKNVRINLNQIDEIFREKKELQKRNSSSIGRKQISNSFFEVRESEYRMERSQRSGQLTQLEKEDIFKVVKKNYSGFRNVNIEQAIKLYSKAVEKKGQEKPNSQQKIYRKEQKHPLICVKDNSLLIEHINLTPQLLTGILLSLPIEKAVGVFLNQIRTSQEVLCFLIDMITIVGVEIESLSIQRVSLESSDTFIDKTKQLLCEVPLKYLTLEFIGIDSKQFCILALGIAQNSSLIQLNFSNNEIDRVAIRSLQLISKHCRSLEKIVLKKNFLEPHLLSHLPTESRQKIKF